MAKIEDHINQRTGGDEVQTYFRNSIPEGSDATLLFIMNLHISWITYRAASSFPRMRAKCLYDRTIVARQRWLARTSRSKAMPKETIRMIDVTVYDDGMSPRGWAL